MKGSLPDEKILLVAVEPGLCFRLGGRFHVLTVETAAEAIRILENGEPVGAILADTQIPDEDAGDFLAQLERRWPDIRRLLLANNSNGEAMIAATNEGRIFRLLQKPSNPDELAAALGEALDEFRFIQRGGETRHPHKAKTPPGEAAPRSILSMMSHELLTPLNHVLGFTSVLEMKLRERDEADALEYLNYIKGSGESLLRMVHRVLEVARLMSEDLQRDRQIVDVRAIISDALETIRAKAEEKSISTSFQAPPQPVLAEVNVNDLRFVLAELLDNALKFNQQGGHVSIAIGAVDDQLTIRVADTGVGISEESIERSLSLLTGGGNADTRRFDGAGLGLSFAMLFARANGGDLVLERREGSGTSVMLTIRRVNAPRLPAARSA